jgi:hypothetical protein
MVEEQGATPPSVSPARGAGEAEPGGVGAKPRWRLWLRPLLLGLAVGAANIAVFLLLPPELLERPSSRRPSPTPPCSCRCPTTRC